MLENPASSKNSMVVARFWMEHHRDTAVLFQGMPKKPEDYIDEHGWISLGELEQLFQRTKKEFADLEVIRRVYEGSYRYLPTTVLWLQYFGTTQMLYAITPWFAQHWNRNLAGVDLPVLTPDSCEFEFIYREGMRGKMSQDVCRSTIGTLENPPKVISPKSGQLAKVSQTHCCVPIEKLDYVDGFQFGVFRDKEVIAFPVEKETGIRLDDVGNYIGNLIEGGSFEFNGVIYGSRGGCRYKIEYDESAGPIRKALRPLLTPVYNIINRRPMSRLVSELVEDKLRLEQLVDDLNTATNSERLARLEAEQARDRAESAEAQVRDYAATLEVRVEERTAEVSKQRDRAEYALRELEKAQSQLVATSQLAMAGELAGGVAHEIKNPLTAIQAQVSFLRGIIEPSVDGFLEYRIRNEVVFPEGASIDPVEVYRPLSKRANDFTAPEGMGMLRLRQDIGQALEGIGVTDRVKDLREELAGLGVSPTDIDDLHVKINLISYRPQVDKILGYLRERQEILHGFRDIESGTGDILSTVTNLTSLVNLQRGEVIHTDLGELLDRSVRLLSLSKDGISVERNYDPAMPPIEAYRDLNQVFFNLLSNARKAIGKDGRIKIITTYHPGDDIAYIQVEDSGRGIPLEIKDRIFEPFVTGDKSGGTGLGLSMSYQIVNDHHHGRIYLAGENPTRFVVEVPVKLAR